MKTMNVLMIGFGVSGALGSGAAWSAEREHDATSLANVLQLRECADKGIDYGNCREIVDDLVEPEIAYSPLGYTAVYTADSIRSKADDIEKKVPEAEIGAGVGIIVLIMGTFVSGAVALHKKIDEYPYEDGR